MSLESARLQRHKVTSLNTLNSATKLINALNDIKNKETYPTYLLTTQDDVNSKDQSVDQVNSNKIKFKNISCLKNKMKILI